MIRLAQLGLFVAPLALYLAWRLAARRGLAGPGPGSFALILAGLLAAGAVLALVALRDPNRPGGSYEPARLGPDGRIVPGRVTPGPEDRRPGD